MARLVTELDVPGLAPPVGPYAHATAVGDLVFISGLLALDADGRLVGPGDATAQAEHIFATLGLILDAVGGDFGDVAKLTIFLIDLADRAALSAVRKQVFGDHRPASTLVQVAGLIGDGTLMEIEAIAARRQGDEPGLTRPDLSSSSRPERSGEPGPRSLAPGLLGPGSPQWGVRDDDLGAPSLFANPSSTPRTKRQGH